jgi:hypothetical protein
MHLLVSGERLTDTYACLPLASSRLVATCGFQFGRSLSLRCSQRQRPKSHVNLATAPINKCHLMWRVTRHNEPEQTSLASGHIVFSMRN